MRQVSAAWLDVAQPVQSFLHRHYAAVAVPGQRRPNSLGSTVRRAARGGPQVAILAAIIPTLAGTPRRIDRRTGMTVASHGRWAATLALRTSWSSPSGLVTRSRRPAPIRVLLLAEEALAGLADRADPQLVVENQEGGGLAGQGVARAVQHHAHAAPVAYALAELGMARRVLGRMAAPRAEPDRLGPPLPHRRPRPINPNESRHAERSQHESNVPARDARSMHRFVPEPCAKSAQVGFQDGGRNTSSGDQRPRRRWRTSRYRASAFRRLWCVGWAG